MATKATTILLDADIIAYKVAARNEQRFDFDGDGQFTIVPNRAAALEDIHSIVDETLAGLNATKVIVCMSDPSNRYFRHDFYPMYKGKRKSVVKPVMLMEMKHALAQTYETYQRSGLEADDCMGILSTNRQLQAARGLGEVIVVSEDKDMRTLPVRVYNPNRPELGVIVISDLDADRFHLWQTIVGDATDDYPGVKGVGESSIYAQEIVSADRDELWDIVLEAYASKGQTEEDAIVQARLARILRSSDWDYDRKRPRLWTPTVLYGAYES